MKLFDSHTHAHFNAFKEDSDEVVQRALAKGVEMLLVGTQIDTSKQSIKQAEKFDGVWAAIGLHPSHVTKGYLDPNEEGSREHSGFERRGEAYDKEAYRKLAETSKKVAAIGEIGLDYYRLDGSEEEKNEIKKKQKSVFKEQLELAVELDLPVSIHCREAYADTYEMLCTIREDHPNLRGVMHCFTGTADEAQLFLSLGFYISFTGIITFAPDWDLFIRQTPLKKLLVETDCPYLTPVPHRGKRNEPMFVEYVVLRIADLKGISFEEVAKVTHKNARRLFAIK